MSEKYILQLTERELHDLKTILVIFSVKDIPSYLAKEQEKILSSVNSIAIKVDGINLKNPI